VSAIESGGLLVDRVDHDQPAAKVTHAFDRNSERLDEEQAAFAFGARQK
jgi:hypothetical protein